MSGLFTSDKLKTRAIELGFSLVGITQAEPSPYLAAYERWIAAEMHGTMGYMARPDRVARRRDLRVILPGARSLIVVGVDYGASLPIEILTDPTRGRIAAYAWGLDYHHVIAPRLETLAEFMRTEYSNLLHRVYVDTGAILERSHAYQAGLGFTGKNTMLIHPQRGSRFFLAEIITDVEFDHYDQPTTPPTMCGQCTRCLQACPTHAFPVPHVLDSRRCISYLTIEHKGSIDPTLRPLMGNWVYGCDVCQDVCPFQRFTPPAIRDTAFLPIDLNRAAPPLRDLLGMDEYTFAARFTGSPIERIRRDRLVRNACIAAGNSGDSSLIPLLANLLHDTDPLVREHAGWGLDQFSRNGASPS